MKLKRKYWILLVIAPLIVVLDQGTKHLIIDHFRLGESLPIISGFFDLVYARNTGAAFGMLANWDPAFRVPFFLLIPTIALFVIGYLFKKLPPKSILLSSALSLVIGGALGNVIDRIQLGYVVDFLYFHWKTDYYFPAFNVADSAICIGVGILMLDMFLQKETEKKK